MKPFRRSLVVTIAGLSFAATLLCHVVPMQGQEPLSSVNMLIGTANEGQTAPLVGMPFSMTNWTPETQGTEQKCVAPYYFKDHTLTGFRASHWLSGSCSQDYGSLTLMPITGAIDPTPAGRASAFRREAEVMTPAYYAVTLDKYQERVEMTGVTRSGMLRVSVPAGMPVTILFEPNARPNEGFVEIHPERKEIVGYNPVHRIYQGNGQTAGFSGYFVARFEQPMQAHGTWCAGEVHTGSDRQGDGCKRLGGYATFAPSATPLLVKVGTSFTSLEEAAKNLDAEEPGFDFDAIRAKTEAVWKRRMRMIEIEGATSDQRRTFYTAFYHASLVPRIASDVDGTYNGFAQEGKLHKIASGDYYDDYSMWDIYRALLPLYTLIDPKRDEQIVQSMVLKGQEGGFLPIFPLWNSYTSEMVGDHTIAIIADAYAKGLKHFDVPEAYRLVMQNATVTPPHDQYVLGKGRRALEDYVKYGYIPLENPVLDAFHRGEQVSRTLEYAFDDADIAIFARSLGHAADADAMQKRSEDWRNVIDPETGFARGRHADGTWATPFDPAKSEHYVTEGLPWQYTFYVPQNVPGLIQATGGREQFVAKLDGLFDRKLYDQGNEPSHHIGYLYDYAGAAWKTQQRVRSVMDTQYHDGPDGLPGNDDAGQMSAWYMLSAIGFYPVAPGTPSYAIGSPLFGRVTVHLPNGNDFTVTASHQGPGNPYIQAQSLNGKSLNGFLITHAQITAGGTLHFDLGPEPKK